MLVAGCVSRHTAMSWRYIGLATGPHSIIIHLAAVTHSALPAVFSGLFFDIFLKLLFFTLHFIELIKLLAFFHIFGIFNHHSRIWN